MPIPKVIYQTWKTKDLHENCIKIRDNIQKLNPDYEMKLYDDEDIDAFIKNNFDDYTYSCYSKLNVGAGKADFWRYCILYKNGGVYLDMDAVILRPLDELIEENDQCIITREGTPVCNNWIMIFEKEHPILLKTINNCCYNITNKTSNDICYLTGPAGPFTLAVHQLLSPLYTKNVQNLCCENDEDLNNILNKQDSPIRCRFYGIDMESFCRAKHQHTADLYNGFKYWREETKLYTD